MKHGYSTFGIKKGLPYTPFLNFEIIKLQSSGVIQLILERHALKKPACRMKKSFDDNVQIRFQKVIFPFSIIILGIVCSIMFLTVEVIE